MSEICANWTQWLKQNRFAGQTKWSFKKLLKYSWDGIISFSSFPLKFATGCGILSFLASVPPLVMVIIKCQIQISDITMIMKSFYIASAAIKDEFQ